MARGQKTGGRKKGTPNKRTQTVTEKLEALGCDPIAGMARIAMNTKNRIELRAHMFKELAQYIAPKCRAVEIRDEAEKVQPLIVVPKPCATAEEWHKQVQEYLNKKGNGSDGSPRLVRKS